MHELSIALSLVEAVCDELPRLGDGARVHAVHVRIGALASVVPEALMFSFELAASGTAIDGARLEIEPVAVVVRCEACRQDRRLTSAQLLQCPVCGLATPTVVRGRELELAALEVLDDCPDRRGQASDSQEE